VSVDATGLESRHISRHFLRRQGRIQYHRRYPKLTAACDNASHLIAGVDLTLGPCNDAPGFAPAIRQAACHLRVQRVMADAAYDAEALHALCRQDLGIRTTIIPVNSRGSDVEPTTRYRRLMHRRFPSKIFGQRWQIESVFSRFKRRLGEALTARSHKRRNQESLLRVLTYDLMIIAEAA
jgi:transposase